MLKLISVWANVSLRWSLLVLQQLCRLTELLQKKKPAGGNDGAAAVPFGHICLEGRCSTMADYLTPRTMDVSYKLTIT